MKPEKAKIAIIVTIIIALLGIAVCGFFLYREYNQPVQEEAEEPVSEAEEASETAAETSPEEPAPAAEVAKPNVNDLAGCSDKLQHPKSTSYLETYEKAKIAPKQGDTAAALVRPQKQEWNADVITYLNRGDTVTVLARENGYSLVKVSDGVAGWVISTDLS